MPKPPILSEEQRKAALEKSVEVRKIRAEIKMKLKLGTLSIEEIIDRSAKDENYGKLKLKSVLESLPGFGKKKAELLLEKLAISDTKRIQGLGVKQKEDLLEEFRQ
jgi:hypothetical protein